MKCCFSFCVHKCLNMITTYTHKSQFNSWKMDGKISVMQDLALVNWWRYWEDRNVMNERFAIAVPTPFFLSHDRSCCTLSYVYPRKLVVPTTISNNLFSQNTPVGQGTCYYFYFTEGRMNYREVALQGPMCLC